MMKYYSVVNDTGLARLASVMALNQKLNLSTMVIGDGGGRDKEVTPGKNKNTVIREVFRASVVLLEAEDPTDPGLLTATLVIPPDKGGFDITEGLLLCDDGTPFANAALTPGYKATPAEGGIGEYIVELVFRISNAEAAAVQLIINPYLAIATRQWVEAFSYSRQEVDTRLIEVLNKSTKADLSGSNQAPAEGTLVFKTHGDKVMQASANGKILTVFVSRTINLKHAKCRLIGPGTEKIATENGLHEIVNLVSPGPFRFLRDNNIWVQL